ncbi:tRNA-splicing endonuclease subunit sen54 [Haplosporangium sp. Z 27]|nr:tRNA-splicing endonuclease subunit sen54 [Haplosporangium sp. Z 27]
MDAADQDDIDQHPDFRLLLNNSKGQSSSQALPSRDAKSARDPAAALEEHYSAYFQILSEERHAAERTYSRAVHEPELGLFRLTANKGTHFVSMGHMLHGQMYLYPEEALYLIDRGSLLIEHLGTEMTVQQMWNVYLSSPYQIKDQSQIDDHNSIEQDDSLPMDRYLTYAYLKRLGFVVIRPGTYDNASRTPNTLPIQNQLILNPSPYMTFLWSIRNSLFATCKKQLGIFVTRVGLRLRSVLDIWSRPSNRPLVSNSDNMSYDQILNTLQIIPTIRLGSTTRIQDGEAAHYMKIGTKKPMIVDFDVYKPAGAFKKRQPGIPGYHVVVVRATDALPTISELKTLMADQADPAQEVSSQKDRSSPSEKGKKKIIDWPKVLFAVVNGGQVSFMTISNVKVIP